jgi:hypothetical protein
MKKVLMLKALLIFGIFVALTITGSPAFADEEVDDEKKRILLLWDAKTVGTLTLIDALYDAGYEVWEIQENEWDGKNPQLDGFDVVIHLNGATFDEPLKVPAQKTLVDFVQEGGGFIGAQWNGFEQKNGMQVDMADLVLQLWPSGDSDNCTGCTMTWTVVSGQETHPVLAGVPSSFTFFADGHDPGPLAELDNPPPIVLMTSPVGGPAVIVREFGNGRIVNFSCAPNTTGKDLTLQNENILKLYINAVAWTISRDPEATIQDLIDAVAGLVSEGELHRWPGFILTLELKIAQKKLDRGYTRRAVRMLKVFIRHVKFLVHRGRLDADYGEQLIDTARDIIDQIIDDSSKGSYKPDID